MERLPTMTGVEIWCVLAVAALVVSVLLWRSKSESQSVQLKQICNITVSEDLNLQLQTLLGQGRSIEAIKLLRERTGLGLREAKDYVDAIARGAQPLVSNGPNAADHVFTNRPAVDDQIASLLDSGKKIEALKLLRDSTGLGLKEAKDRLDKMDAKLRS